MRLGSIQRYSRLAALLWKYGRGDLVEDANERAALEKDGRAEAHPDELADDLERMGPVYIKLAQVLSSRADVLPEKYVKALARLQDKVTPFPFEEVQRIVTEELGARLSKAFASFDPEPLATASLGQVHTAVLRDGREIVVKVQRPDIERDIAEEFEVLRRIAVFVDAHTDVGRRQRFTAMLDEFHATILQELDYQREAENLRTLGRNMREFERIHVPQPIEGYCTRVVLTMERVDGHKLTSLSPVALLDVDAHELADELFRAYLKQVVIDGFFHADPHPGNVFLTRDGRLALLDLGMVGRPALAMREQLLKVMLAVSEGKGDVAADVVSGFSERDEGYDSDAFRRRIDKVIAAHQDRPLEQMNVGRSLLDVVHAATESHLHVPSELSLLGKTLLQLEQIGRKLDPEFDPKESVHRNAGQLATRRMLKSATQGSLFGSLLEAKTLMLDLPSRLNRILEALSNGEFEMRVRSADVKMVVEGIEKVANRITAGLVLAALIVGAALLMRVDTTFRLFGYPGFAMVCFLVAGAGGFWLVATTLITDRRSKRSQRR